MSGLDRQHLLVPYVMSARTEMFSRSSSNRRALRKKSCGNHFPRTTWSVSLADISLELFSEEIEVRIRNVQRLVSMTSCHSVRGLSDLVTETAGQDGLVYTSLETVLGMSRSTLVPRKIVPCLK